MGKRTGTRTAMVASAAVLLREYGPQGTSFAKVLEHSGGPRGSVGHHFPGGKTELVADAVRYAGNTVTDLLRAAIPKGIPATGVFAAICAHYRKQLTDSDFAAGCPVGFVGQEAFADETLGPVVKEVFDDWTSALTELLIASGHERTAAAELAELSVAAIEGAILTARVKHSTTPLDSVERHIGPLLA